MFARTSTCIISKKYRNVDNIEILDAREKYQTSMQKIFRFKMQINLIIIKIIVNWLFN